MSFAVSDPTGFVSLGLYTPKPLMFRELHLRCQGPCLPDYLYSVDLRGGMSVEFVGVLR